MMLTVFAASSGYTLADIPSTTVVGLLMVFSVLGVIYLCLVLMERAMRKKSGVQQVRSPLDGVFERALQSGQVKSGDAVAIVRDSAGARSELLSPVAGRVVCLKQPDDSVRRGDVVFTVEEEAK